MFKKWLWIGIAIGILLLACQPATATWWDSSWNDKVAIQINNTEGTELSYYPVKLTVPYVTGMQSDFDDIRIINETAKSTVPYWIEDKTDGVTCDLWFNATHINGGSLCNDTYFVYYGNPAASSMSSRVDTFEFYDDFSASSPYAGTWIEVDPNGHIVIDRATDDRLEFTGLERWEHAYVYQPHLIDNKVISIKFNITSVEEQGMVMVFGASDTIGSRNTWNNGIDSYVYRYLDTGEYVIEQHVNSTPYCWSRDTFSFNTSYWADIHIMSTNVPVFSLYNDSLKKNKIFSQSWYTTPGSPYSYIYAISSIYSDTNLHITGYIDDYQVRKAIYNEPSAACSLMSLQPANNSIDQPINTTLNWSYLDPEGDTVYYDVWFGTENDTLVLVSEDQLTTEYQPTFDLDYNTKYKWQIVATDKDGSITSEVWYFTTEQIDCTGKFYLTVKARDVSTGENLNSFTAYLSNGEARETVYGETTFTCLDDGYYSVAVSSSAYQDNQENIILDQNKTVIVYLLPLSKEDYFLPPKHLVEFRVIDFWGNGVPDIVVTSQRVESTVPDESWWDDLFGIDDSVVGTNITMEGTTDSEGAISFYMVETIKYRVCFTKPSEGINITWYKYPKEDKYTIYIWNKEDTEVIAPSEQSFALNVTINVSKDDSGIINVSYLDTSLGTADLTYFINKTSLTGVDNETVECSGTKYATTSENISCVLSDFTGGNYYITLLIDHTLFGQHKKIYSVKFPGVRLDLGFEDLNVYLWIAICSLFLIGMLFGRSSADQGALFVCIGGWMFFGFGWFAPVGVAAPTVLSFITALVILNIYVKRGHEAGFG